VVGPTSLTDVDRVLAEMGSRSVSLSTRKHTLRRGADHDYRERLAGLCFTHAATRGGISLILYDETTLYFEADAEDGRRKVGYSNYAEAAVMPSSWWLWWCSCCSAGLAGVSCAG
jgi:hypothetical protein